MAKSAAAEDEELLQLLEAILIKYHYDFRGYSAVSMRRRLMQAAIRFKCADLKELRNLILSSPSAPPELLSFLTVQVTEMFRDPACYKAIRETVLPHLRTYPALKVWVAGCCGGEELYSYAILFEEEGLMDRTLFYATDISIEALKRAEAGVYELSRMELFADNHRKSGGKVPLSDYYTAAYGAASFSGRLRRHAVFSDHNLVTDEVFSEMHLISCRNVLIYFDRPLQDRAIGLFRRSLVRKGFLGLGTKESLRFSAHAEAFSEFSREQHLYQKDAA